MARPSHEMEDWHQPVKQSLKDLNLTVYKFSKDSGILMQSIDSNIRNNSIPCIETILQCKLVQLYFSNREKNRVEKILESKGITAKVTVDKVRDVYTVRIEAKDFELFRDPISGEYMTISKKPHFLIDELNQK